VVEPLEPALNPMIPVRRFLLIALAVSGCVREFRPPPVQELQLGTKTAPYRTYAAKTLCFAGRDYQPTLKGELTAMNELLGAFLQGTSAGPEGVWATEHVQMLEHAQSALTPALDAYEATLSQAKDCLFEHKYEFPELARKGLELVRQSRQRVADAGGLLPTVRAKAELSKWKDQLAKDQDSEHSNWCPPKPRPAPDVYFALEDETGRTEWLFCDGTKVVNHPGAKAPEYVAPGEGRPASKSMQSSYLKAAAKYPSSQIRRAPKTPEPTAGESPGSGGH
jgi:hypothetical protein